MLIRRISSRKLKIALEKALRYVFFVINHCDVNTGKSNKITYFNFSFYLSQPIAIPTKPPP